MLEVILFIINTTMVHGRVGQSIESTERQAEDPRIIHIFAGGVKESKSYWAKKIC